jgi:subtilase family serine protease
MPLAAQEARPAPPRITQDIDETELVLLAGNTHPLARAEYDQGAAPPDLPMERMLLLLRRSPEQEASLQQLLEEQQDPGSVHYHQWLTPEQFGDQFGPALEDMGKITGWLKSQGFRVDGVANSRIVVEFSGTAAQVERGLHTQIHSFLVNGEQHWANAHDPQIPAALSPVVAGIVSLHNFPMKAMHRRAGAFRRAPGNDAWVPASPAPEFTYATNGGTAYVVGPYDFATIYNVLPLWNANAAIDGTGQSIAIVARSNIALQDVRNFRSLFGLPAHDPTITLNGPDPGTANVDNEFENVLDVEWAGAVAKGATINLVVSKSTTATDGSDLSAQYIVNNNLAPVLSSSYGSCELFMQLTSRSQFYNSLWQQAAAQGITVVVAAGDAGSATCDENENAALLGLQVDGAASTPYNVAVGGTDFSDVFSQNQGLYWSYNHPVTLESANSYVPEMTWNDSCASPELVSYFGPGFGSSSAEALCNNPQKQLPLLDVTGGGGGASTLYSKPAWQSGVSGIPSDGHRDVPDVSLFAGDGAWQHYYVVCQTDNGGPCNPSSPVGLVVTGGGGDSFGAPAFAGIMALVNQETGSRQGLANPTLYHLASAEYGNSNSPNTANLLACNASTPPPSGNACVFYDVTAGNNDVPCQKGSLNCYVSNPSDKYGLLSTSSNSLVPAYAAGPGYDLATGLGSINVANLVNKWPSPNTPLSISKAHTGNFAAGQTNATYTVTVSNGASAGPTSGMVTVSENAPVGLTLVSMAGSGWSCGGSACTRSDVLNPGSSYPAITVTVNVASNAPSQLTNQVTVSGGGSVSATASDVTRIATQVSTTTAVVASPSTIATTASTTLTATVTPNSGNGTPTGTVAFALGSMALGSATLTLTGGAAQATLTVKGTELAVGSDTITASYSGDANFASSSASATVTVTQSTPPSSGYTISTVAGNGTSGSSGDGGPASSAELGYPSGVAVDGAGNLFIADTFNARIRKVTPAGAISTVAGNGTRGFTGDGGPATSAELRLPGGVAVDSVGDLFIADETNNRIRKVTAAGAISTVAGNGTPGFSGDGGPATSAELFEPGGLAVDSGGNLFIADSMNNRIRKVTPAGTISTVAGNGVEGFGGDGQPAIVAELNQPNGVAIDSAGNLFIADLANNRIRKVTPAGTISTVAGNGTPGFSGDGGPATSAELFSPWDVAVDGAGNLFIADAFNDCIRKVTPGGTIGTVAGNGTPGFSGDGGLSTLAELRMPEAVAVDGAGNLFIADTSVVSSK